MRVWKALGIAGVVGVAAVGVAVGAKSIERQRRVYRDADVGQLRDHLRDKLRKLDEAPPIPAP